MEPFKELKQLYLNSRAKEIAKGGGPNAKISREEYDEYIVIMSLAAEKLGWEIPASPSQPPATRRLVFVENKSGLAM